MRNRDIITLQFIKCPYKIELISLDECKQCEVFDGINGNCIICLDD